MSGYIKDRWLWLGLGLAFTISSLIVGFTTSPAPKQQDEGTQVNEGDIVPVPSTLPIKTLRTLMDSPNPNIRQMAIDLVVKRMQDEDLRSGVMAAINVDIGSADEDTRRKAILTLEYLFQRDVSQTPGSPSMSVASTSAAHDESTWLDGQEPVIPSLATPVAGWTAVPRERPAASDSDVRRRRREAVVLHEGSGELNEDDIIRPSDTWQTMQS